MRTRIRSIAFASLLLLVIPSIAKSLDRDHRERSKEAAYQAGFDDGYRNGFRYGEYDYRTHAGYHYRSREYDRAGGYYESDFANKSHYRKGYKDGYREGYRSGYGRRGYSRYPHRGFFD